MSERTRRATEASMIHADFIEGCRPGSPKDMFESSLLDVTNDPNDVRYGHQDFVYRGLGFQGMLKKTASEAMTFAITTTLMDEIRVTLDFLHSENIDFLPLRREMVPCDSGFVVFPFGIDISDVLEFVEDAGLSKKRTLGPNGWVTNFMDLGGGDRWFIDGFMWCTSEIVAHDLDLRPTEGVLLFPLTRWRGRDDDRPFRLHRHIDKSQLPPEFVASDCTGWAWDAEGQTEWDEATWGEYYKNPKARTDEFNEAVKLRLRSIYWVVWRWMTEEVWIPERPNRPVQRRISRLRPEFGTQAPEDGSMVIVDLRLERQEGEAPKGEEPAWWRARWKVRDHWARRRIAIRDENGNSVGPVTGPKAVYGVTYKYKWVKIKEYEKGPEDAPLVDKEKVGVLWR
jgi:hypothetical protein